MPIKPYNGISSSSTSGTPGPRGLQGEQGEKGDPGPRGLQGVPGPQGEQGDPGPVGATGLIWQGQYSDDTTYEENDAVSYEGATYFSIEASTGHAPDPTTGLNQYWALMAAEGARGKQGPNGVQGPDGEKGEPGEQGERGESAYETAVELGFVGTEEEWIASLHGQNGTNGAAGKAGAKGDPGSQGTPGDVGPQGLSAYQVAVASGYTGTESEWLASLKGKDAPLPKRYFCVSPATGKDAKFPLGDSGLYYVTRGLSNGDLALGIYDENSPRQISYRFIAMYGGAGLDGYWNQAYTTTNSVYILDAVSYMDAEENQTIWMSDLTTGRIWKIERWGISRLLKRYYVEINEITSGSQLYIDYSV